MPREVPSVSNTELALLQVLWNKGQATIRELAGEIYPAFTSAQYATVQKLLDRLEEKDCVRRDRSERAHLFRPTLSREEFIGSGLQSLADKACGGSLTPLLTHLVRAQALTAEERASLRSLVDELSRSKKSSER